jgi:phospholipase D1/2
VHSKLYIADDVYVISGSAGIERAGFTNDIEMSVAIFDEAGSFESSSQSCSTFACMLRTRLWGEYLMLPPTDEKILDVEQAVKEFVKQADDGQQRVRHYFPIETGDHVYYRALYDIYEPEGRCT